MENVFVLAGIPLIMQSMLESLKHRLTGGLPVRSRSVLLHLPESMIAAGLRDMQARNPTADIGSYPFYRQGKGGTSIVIRSTDEALNAELANEVYAIAAKLGGNPQFEES